MAIRIRTVEGTVIAICAAKSEPEEGDLYLNDSAHHAVYEKIAADLNSEGFLPDGYGADKKVLHLMNQVQKGNGG